MPTIDYENNGVEREYEATTYTLMVYEQEFCNSSNENVTGDLIKDVFGRIDIRQAARNIDDNGNTVAFDFTIDNWSAELRAFWAMLKTSEAICKRDNRPCLPVPSFVQWCLSTRSIDMGQVSQCVWDECQRGLFRSRAAISKEGDGE